MPETTHKNFRLSVLKALAWLSNQMPDTGIELQRVRDAVLFLEGIDLKNSPTPLLGNSPPGLYRQVDLAFRNQREGYCGTGVAAATLLLPDGKWAITDAGLKTLPRSERKGPTPAFFKERVLRALTVLSGQRCANSVHYADVYTEVLRKFGIDPEGTTLPMKGFNRDINLAFRSMREGYCAKGTEPLTKQVRRNRWMITEEGLAQTLGHRKTLTALWLASRPPKFHTAIQNALRAKMPQSAHMGLVQDHHSSVMLKWITRDAFKERIEANKPPTEAECCCWAVRSAYTDIRGDGRDAIGVVRGAKTATMRVKVQKDEQILANATIRENLLTQESCAQTCIQEGELDFVDLMGGDPSQCIELKEMLGAMIHAIQSCNQVSPDLYVRIFKMHYLEGRTIKAISAIEGIACSRISTMIKEIGETMQQARQQGNLEWPIYQATDDVYSVMMSASDRN